MHSHQQPLVQHTAHVKRPREDLYPSAHTSTTRRTASHTRTHARYSCTLLQHEPPRTPHHSRYSLSLVCFLRCTATTTATPFTATQLDEGSEMTLLLLHELPTPLRGWVKEQHALFLQENSVQPWKFGTCEGVVCEHGWPLPLLSLYSIAASWTCSFRKCT